MKKLTLKKTVSVLLALCVMLGLSAALATGNDVFTLEADRLTVRLPEGTEPEIGCFSGNYALVPAAESVTVDGVTETVYVLTEEAKKEAQLFQIAADLSGGEGTEVHGMMFASEVGGKMYRMGHSLWTPEYYVDISEGYEYSDGQTLLIQLPGGEYTGYVWSLIPDNSGVLELVDSYEIDMRDHEEDPLVTATGFFFLPTEAPLGTVAHVRFTLDEAPEGVETGIALEFEVTLDADGQITEAIRVE